MEHKDELEFKLEYPIEFDHGGEKLPAELLVLRAPSNKQHKYRVRLQQGFFQAINSLKASGAEPKDQDVDIGGGEVLALMLSSDVDMVAFHETFAKLIQSAVCKVEDKEPLSILLYEKIHPDDLDRLMGDYLVNFILASALRTLSEK